MSYSEIISTISLMFSFLALSVNAYPHLRDYESKNDERRKLMLENFTKTTWTNEGDIFTTPKAHYNVTFTKADGISRVYGNIEVNIEDDNYFFHGSINKSGILKTTLLREQGKFGIPIATVEFRYSKESDEITFKCLGFIGPSENASEYNLIDTTQLLWRNPI